MLYTPLKSLLFLGDPERAHERVLSWIEMLEKSAGGRTFLRTLAGPVVSNAQTAMDIDFKHPVGMAAGFDKNARVIIALQELGFSFVEIGTVTPRAQAGNSKPRLWRFRESRALVNALGFPGEGVENVRARLVSLRAGKLLKIPVGVNIGKNADTALENAADDYVNVLDRLYDFGDYFVVNVSSPNTVGLRDLQTVESLKNIVDPLQNILTKRRAKPLLVKISPDLNDEDVKSIARFAKEINIAGIIAANTTINRPLVPRAATLDRGGLSGRPLFERTQQLIPILRNELYASQAIIASGGISTLRDVQECLNLGANLVQVYTAFVYQGPGCVSGLTAI